MHFLTIFLLTVGIMVNNTGAQWPLNTSQNLPVAVGPDRKANPQITATSDGCYLLVWEDERNGTRDIYAQKMDKSGYLLWAVDGVPVCVEVQTQRYPQLTADSAGGAYIVWEDFRTGQKDIYMQRLDKDGQPHWALNGIAISAAASDQNYPVIAPDGMGGAFVVWESHQTSGVYTDLYAQRIAPDGSVYWQVNGIIISNENRGQRYPRIVLDRPLKAFIVWVDSRANLDYPDIYAQYVDGNGNMQWAPNGIVVSSGPAEQEDVEVAADGNGNLFACWKDSRNGGSDIYAQMIDSTGNAVWPIPDGTPICTASSSQYSPHIVTDYRGGCIISWHDFRNSTDRLLNVDVYAQRMDAAGNALWQFSGVPVTTASSNQIDEMLVADKKGGAVIVWRDHVSGVTDLYAQHLDSSGTAQWPGSPGVPVSLAGGSQRAQVLAPDGDGGVVVVWADERELAANVSDIYTHYVSQKGEYSNALPGIKLNELYYAGPVNTSNYFYDQFIELYNSSSATRYLDGLIIGRVLNSSSYNLAQADSVFVSYTYQFPGQPGEQNYPIGPGEYAVIAQDALNHQSVIPSSVNLETSHWEFYNQFSGNDFDNPAVPNLTNINAGYDNEFYMHLSAGYVVLADGSEIRQEGSYKVIPLHSVLDGMEYHRDSTAVKYSNLLVDAGAAGIGLQRYSGQSIQRMGQGDDTNNSDYDFEILSSPTPEIPVSISSGNDQPVLKYHLFANYPNPFNPRTTMTYQLPEYASVKLVIFNSIGEQVKLLVNENQAPGNYSVVWNGTDYRGRPVSSGIYFL
ncbi:MAG: DUF4876 domain-containing protein, partial [Calditrichia bacterium]